MPPPPVPPAPRRPFLDLRVGEGRDFGRAFLAFFLLFVSWYCVRPVREAMGIQRGADDLPGLMLATVVVTLAVNPLYARLATRLARRALVRLVLRFLALNLVAFHLVLAMGPRFGLELSAQASVWLGHVLYVWVTVFGVWIVSVLWSLFSEVFTSAAARRLFGPLTAGCSFGAWAGAMAAGDLAVRLDQPLHLLLLAALFLELATRAAVGVRVPASSGETEARSAPLEQPLTGSSLEGFRLVARDPLLRGILLYILVSTIARTIVYLVQGELVAEAAEGTGERIGIFASIDAWTSATTFFLQLFAVGAVVGRLGVGWALAALPLAATAGFVALALAPGLAVVKLVQVLLRATNYGFAKPAREMLWPVLSPVEKQKAKNLLDVGLYRTGDAIGSISKWTLGSLGLSAAAISGVAAPLAALGLLVIPGMVRAHRARGGFDQTPGPPDAPG